MDVELMNEMKEKTILHWNYRNLVFFPEILQEGHHIKEIYLKWNHISKLPEWLGHLGNLTDLYISGNSLKTLPNEIANLKLLACLDIGWNNLETLPSTIGRLCCLTVLNVSENGLTHLPEEICHLVSLKILLLSGNKLTYLPDSICYCYNLQEVCLDDNSLTYLPQQIVYLPNLQFLSIVQNQILYLPSLPFISSPQLRFERNPYLNYLTYCLGSQISSYSNYAEDGMDMWSLDTDGCLQTNVENTFNKNIVLCSELFSSNGTEMRLVMPKGLNTICQPCSKRKKVPPLYELAIREVYQYSYYHKLNIVNRGGNHVFSMIREQIHDWNIGIFPRDIDILLRNGPITLCSNPRCNKPVFSYAIMWIIQKFIVNRYGVVNEILSTLFFCAESCYLTCQVYNELVPFHIEWCRIGDV